MTAEQQTGAVQALNGTVEHITYKNDANGYTVAVLETADGSVTVVGMMPFLSVGDTLTVTGRFDKHPTYGSQFKVESFEKSAPSTLAGILNYLSSGAVRGVGPATARAIVERFGERALEVIEHTPEELAKIRGISLTKARNIGEEYQKQFGIKDIMLFLSRFKVTPDAAVRVFKALGENAAEVIRRNPYTLCCEEIGFSFEKAEEVAAAFGIDKESDCRIAAAVEYVLRHNLMNGHTCLPQQKVFAVTAELLGCGPERVQEVCKQMQQALQLRTGQKNGEIFLFLPKYYMAEEFIAARLSVLLKYAPPSEFMAEQEIDYIEKRQGIHYEENQRSAIKMSLENGIMVLTGGPGTGKTTTLNAMIKILAGKGLEIALAAPTGRAAKRMSELTGCEAKTIHRLLEVEWDENDRQKFARNEKNPLSCDVLIIDEMSMVDVLLFEAVLRALRLGCRLIMVGDADQLPSVGAGNVLADVLEAGCVPAIRLSKVFRQAMESLIISNAHRIIAGEPPVLDCKTSDFFMLRQADSFNAGQLVCELFAERLPKAYGFDPITDIQVLCPSRMMELGSRNLNNLLQLRLNPLKKGMKKIVFKGFELREGDKVMQIKNNYDILWTAGSGESGSGVFNGDIGILEKIDPPSGVVQVRFDDRLATYYNENLGELDLAYAMTIHKSQGSEFECVILPVLDAPQKLLYRNLLYTAVTRAKRLLIAVGSRELLQKMVQNNRKTLRYTSLAQRLAESFEKNV